MLRGDVGPGSGLGWRTGRGWTEVDEGEEAEAGMAMAEETVSQLPGGGFARVVMERDWESEAAAAAAVALDADVEDGCDFDCSGANFWPARKAERKEVKKVGRGAD